MKVSVLTGGFDKTYALGLISSIKNRPIQVDFIGSNELLDDRIMKINNVNFLNFEDRRKKDDTFFEKVFKILCCYTKIIKYAWSTDSKIFHILWTNRFEYFDRIFLNVYYKLLGKKIVFTAHNVDKQERDGRSTVINKVSLIFMYKIVDHIFVHTEKMRLQLKEKFYINENKISIIPFGINNTLPITNIDSKYAKIQLGLKKNEKTILFFGLIAPYKGLDLLLSAFEKIIKVDVNYKLIIAGQVKNNEYIDYWNAIQEKIKNEFIENNVLQKIEYIPDQDVEIYFKGSDVLVLPYKFIYQSGVLSISYNYGLPVIATDVGSMRESIVSGKTGFVCHENTADALAKCITQYFNSELYANLEYNRQNIIRFANDTFSWDKVGDITYSVYQRVCNNINI